MVICFECSPSIKKVMDELVDSGRYTDYSELIQLAVANMAVLEGEVSQKGVASFTTEAYSRELSTGLAVNEHANKPYRATVAVEEDGVDERLTALQVPTIFAELDFSDDKLSTASLAGDVWSTGQTVPVDRWIFGQHNKLLPTKASCRAILHLMIENGGKAISLKEAVERIVPEAATLGDRLRDYDRVYKIDRDDLLSTAFPSSGKNGDKSRLRFGSQFVGHFNSDGQLTGLPADLKLINRIGRRHDKIALTVAGVEFAILSNPVLDQKRYLEGVKFSPTEVSRILEHISQHVPAEDYAFRVVLKTIAEGVDTPDSLDESLRDGMKLPNEGGISDSFLTTQRSGVIARLYDLGLVRRVREGVRVKYEITEVGNLFLDKS